MEQYRGKPIYVKKEEQGYVQLDVHKLVDLLISKGIITIDDLDGYEKKGEF